MVTLKQIFEKICGKEIRDDDMHHHVTLMSVQPKQYYILFFLEWILCEVLGKKVIFFKLI